MEHRQAPPVGSVSLECLIPMILECDVRHGVLCFMPDPRDAFVIPFFHQIDQLGICHSICRVCFQSASENTKLITGEEQHQFKGVTTELGELRPEHSATEKRR